MQEMARFRDWYVPFFEKDEHRKSKVYKKLSPYTIKTPLINNSKYLNSIFNTNVFFKLEFLQNSGCFKIRGAINNILNLDKKQRINGITAVSAGNHAIASSYAANLFSIKNKIFMYDSANQYRIDKVKSLNANLQLTNPVNAFKDVEKASNEENFYFIHPFEGKYTIQGTASLGYEISKQIENIDNVIISVGGAKVSNPEDVIKAIEMNGVGKPLTFILRRGIREIKLSITPTEMK